MATLNDLRIRTRLRLGELTPGTFGIEDYEGRDDVDEVKLALNSAQVEVCRDIFTQQWMPFRRLQSTLPLFSEQTIYTLPRDYIQMVSVYHKKDNSDPPLQLTPKILNNYREQDYHRYAGRTYNYLSHYEVSGQIGEVLAEGNVTWTDGSQLAADDVSLTRVRVGDIVQNITDGSQGVITNFGSGIASLEDGLHGGRSNRLQFGDEFLIQSREESRFALETWPTITLEEIKIKTEQVDEYTYGGSVFFRVAEDAIIENINVRLSQDLFMNTTKHTNIIETMSKSFVSERVPADFSNDFSYIRSVGDDILTINYLDHQREFLTSQDRVGETVLIKGDGIDWKLKIKSVRDLDPQSMANAMEIDETQSTRTGRLIDSTAYDIEFYSDTPIEVENIGVLSNVTPQTRLIFWLRRVIDIERHEYEDIDIIGWQNVKAGINELSVLEAEINKGKGFIQLNRGEMYEIFIGNADTGQGLIIEPFTTADITLLQPPTDHLIINYVKRPAEFILEESICELYDELHELVIEKAVLTLMRKKDPKMINGSILQYYKTLVEEAKEFLANLLPPDNMTIDTEVPGLSTHTPNHSSWYW